MKRITAIILVLLLTLSLAACGSSNNKKAGNNNADGTYVITRLIRDGVDDSNEIDGYSKDEMPTLVIKGNKATVSSLVEEDDIETRVIDFDQKTMTSEDGDIALFELNGDIITYNAYNGGIIAEFKRE